MKGCTEKWESAIKRVREEAGKVKTDQEKKLEALNIKVAEHHEALKKVMNKVCFPEGREKAWDNLDRMTSVHRMWEEAKGQSEEDTKEEAK